MELLTDSQLVQSTLEGEGQAFGVLARRYQTVLGRYFRLHHAPDDADELVQETFLEAWRCLNHYDPRWQFSTWLFAIARRQSAHWFRKRKREPEPGVGPEPATGLESDPAHVAMSVEESQRLWTRISALLPREQTDALWLFYVEEQSLKDISAIMGRSLTGVKTLLHRAKRALQKHFSRFNGGPHERP